MVNSKKRKLIYIGLGLVVTTYLIFAWLLPYSIKWSVETIGTEVAGAEVNLDDVTISYIPLGITLTDMQVTDARQPENNLFQFDQAQVELEWLPLISGQTVIDQLKVNAIALDQPRSEVGQVVKRDKDSVDTTITDSISNQFAGLSTQLPSVDELLERENLTTRTLQQQLQSNFAVNQTRIDAARTDLPSSEQLKQYQARVDEIIKAPIENIEDLQQRQRQLNLLKQEIREQRSKVDALVTAVEDGASTLKSDLKQLRRAPAQDAQYLADKYTFDADGGLNITALVLGEEARYYAETALYWYQTLAPYIDLSSATDVDDTSNKDDTDSSNSEPALIIRDAIFSMLTDNGELLIVGNNISDKPQALGRSTVFKLDGTNISNIANLDGIVEFNKGLDQGLDRSLLESVVSINAQGWQIDNIPVGLDDLLWQADNTNANFEARVNQGVLDAKGIMDIGQSVFRQLDQNDGDDDIIQTLNNLDKISFAGEAMGTITNPDLSISSDLDRALKRIIKKRMKAKTKAFKTQINEALAAEVAQSSNQYQEQLQLLNGEQDMLASQSNNLNDLLKQGLADLKNQKKNEFVENAKEKLRSFF